MSSSRSYNSVGIVGNDVIDYINPTSYTDKNYEYFNSEVVIKYLRWVE